MKRATSPVLANFVFLASIQGINLLAPMLTLPYLARTVGLDHLGILATAAATCAWLSIVIDYGFNLTATRSISTQRDDPDMVSRIYSAVMSAKLGLIAGAFAMFVAIAAIFPSTRLYLSVYVFSFTFVVAQALLPVWIFQGMEHMAPLAVINAVGKLTAAALTLTLIKRPQDFAGVPLINTCVSLVSALAATWVLHTRLRVRFMRPDKKQVRHVLREGRAVFVATAAGNIYNQGPVLILNAFADAASVGKYSIAQKVATAAVSLFQSLSQAYFPQLARMWAESSERFVALMKRYLLATQLASAVLFGVLFALAPFVYLLLTGMRDADGIAAIRYWMVAAQLIVFSVMINPVLIAIGRDRDMARMYIGCGFAFLAYGCILTKFFLLRGMLTSILIVEVTIAIASAVSVMRNVRVSRASAA